MDEPLFHVADAEEWAAAQATGRYAGSTRGRTFAEEGFVHLSTADQWRGVLERFYGGYPGSLVLLSVDQARLPEPVRWEPPAPGADELFPHLYALLPVDAVVDVRPLDAP